MLPFLSWSNTLLFLRLALASQMSSCPCLLSAGIKAWATTSGYSIYFFLLHIGSLFLQPETTCTVINTLVVMFFLFLIFLLLIQLVDERCVRSPSVRVSVSISLIHQFSGHWEPLCKCLLLLYAQLSICFKFLGISQLLEGTFPWLPASIVAVKSYVRLLFICLLSLAAGSSYFLVIYDMSGMCWGWMLLNLLSLV